MNSLQENLQKKMKAFKLNMHALSVKAHLSPGAVKQIFKNESHPRLDTVIKIAEVFNCSLDELVYGIEKGEEMDKLKENNNNSTLDRELFTTAILEMDAILEEKNTNLTSQQRLKAYLMWYELRSLKISNTDKEKFETVMRMVK